MIDSGRHQQNLIGAFFPGGNSIAQRHGAGSVKRESTSGVAEKRNATIKGGFRGDRQRREVGAIPG